jgi:hypothetical protein
VDRIYGGFNTSFNIKQKTPTNKQEQNDRYNALRIHGKIRIERFSTTTHTHFGKMKYRRPAIWLLSWFAFVKTRLRIDSSQWACRDCTIPFSSSSISDLIRIVAFRDSKELAWREFVEKSSSTLCCHLCAPKFEALPCGLSQIHKCDTAYGKCFDG